MFRRVDEQEHPAPLASTYRIAWDKGRICPEIGCPLCGATIVARRVDAFGQVEYATFCRSCPWWGYVALQEWDQVRRAYGEAADRPPADHVSEIRSLQARGTRHAA